MGFGIVEKLGHVVEDSAQKEKGRVEVDAIRCLHKMHLSSAYMQVLHIVVLYVKIMLTNEI